MVKLLSRTLAESLVPENQKKTEVDNTSGITIRYRLADQDRISLPFSELVAIVDKARKFGQLENAGKIDEDYLRRELGLIPVLGETEGKMTNAMERHLKKVS